MNYRPWPLCFTIVGLGAVMVFISEAIVYLSK